MRSHWIPGRQALIMRVCFIEDTRLHGGTQIWVVEAAQSFLEAGLQVTVLTPESGWVAAECRRTRARVVTYDELAVVSECSAAQETWADALSDSDVAVCTVHPPRDGFHCSVFAARVIQERGLKTVLVPKTGTIVPSYERRFYLPDERIRSSIIAISGFTRAYLIDAYGIPEEAVALIYQGTDVEMLAKDASRVPEARRRYPVPAGASPVLGCVGSMEGRKGLDRMLEAMADVKAALPSAHLILVGDGPDEPALRSMAQAGGLDQWVSFHPFTREPIYAFEVLDILVLPSLCKEGLPNVLQEAMSMGVPVVSSRLAGVPEVVLDGETGYMVTPGDTRMLADAIIRLWSNANTYQSMATNARLLMASRFDKSRQFVEFQRHLETLSAMD